MTRISSSIWNELKMNLIEKLEKEIKDLVDLDLQVKNIRSYVYYTLSALEKIEQIKLDSNFTYQIKLNINKIKDLTNKWVSEINVEIKYKNRDLELIQNNRDKKNGKNNK